MKKIFTLRILFILLVFNNISDAQTENPYSGFDPSALKENAAYARNFSPNDYDGRILYGCMSEMTDLARAQYAFRLPMKHDERIDSAAQFQADYQAGREERTELNMAPYKTLPFRLRKYGLAGNGTEFVAKVKAYVGAEEYCYYDVCLNIMQSILKNAKTAAVFLDGQFTYMGFGFQCDFVMRNLYASIVFGNDRTFNLYKPAYGAKGLPYTKGGAGLKAYDPKLCRKYAADPNMEQLSEFIQLKKDGSVYMIADNYKVVKKLIGKEGDAIAVDFVQHRQYDCQNSMRDYDLHHRGMVSKPVTFAKIMEANENTNIKSGKIVAKIATLPEEIDLDEPLDLHILVLKEGRCLCRTVIPKSIEAKRADYEATVHILKDNSIRPRGEWTATPETDRIQVFFPYELKKTDYTWDESLLAAAGRPDYEVRKINVIAHNSINYYNDAAYQKIQARRLEYFRKDLAARYPGVEIHTEYDFDWSQFKKEIVNNGEYYDYSFMEMDEAAKALRGDKYACKALEDEYLAPHRKYEVQFEIVYRIDTKDREEAFAVWKFNRAIAQNNRPLAMAVENYMIGRVEQGAYTAEPVRSMRIPAKKPFQTFLNNRLYMLNVLAGKITPEICTEMQKTYALDPSNQKLLYNTTLCDMYRTPADNVADIAGMQSQLDRLYSISSIPKELANNLNMEFQFKVIRYLDTASATVENTALKAATFARVKSIRNPVMESWQNAYKLASYFVKDYDYMYALSLMDPFLAGDTTVSDDFIFSYISIAAHREETYLSGLFAKAVSMADERDPARLCGLFDRLPCCVLENEEVKSIICKTCNR